MTAETAKRTAAVILTGIFVLGIFNLTGKNRTSPAAETSSASALNESASLTADLPAGGISFAAADSSSPADVSDALVSSAPADVSADSESAGAEASSKDADVSGAAAESKDNSSVPAAYEDLASHVRGVRAFSIMEGQDPDVLAGVSWGSPVKEVKADKDAVSWNKPGSYTLTFTASDDAGRTAKLTAKVTVRKDLEQFLYGMEGEASVRTGGTFDPMANVTWEDAIASVKADTSQLHTDKAGDYLISYLLTAPDGQTQTAVRKVTVKNADTPSGASGYASVTDLGLWRLTAYMDTAADQGAFVGQTASGHPLTAGETVAVSEATCARLGLSFGDRLMVNGHIYTLEDYGGSAMNNANWMDIFVTNETDEYSEAYNQYARVYLLR